MRRLGPHGEMELTEEEAAQLEAVFLAQTAESLETVDRCALALETEGDAAAALAEIRRVVHTLKGDAAALGYTRVAALAHRLEGAIAAAPADEVQGAPERDPELLTPPLLEWTDLVRSLLEPVEPAAGAVEAALDDALAKLEEALAERRHERPGSPRATPRTLLVSATGAQPVRRAETVRVDAARLDNVLALVGDLVIARAEIRVAVAGLAARRLRAPEVERLGEAASRLERSVRELQRTVLGTRLVPIDVLFRRLPRTAREVALTCGRQVRLAVSGGETELDRRLVDALAEPLLHIVRNAVDHGVEPAEVRLATGKPAEGLVAVTARHVGHQVVVEVVDDGRGIDREALGRRAVERGVVGAEALASMGDAELLRLIFAPGLSTATAVTEVSGRGIGMDVVQQTVERLRGRVEVESSPGAGTRITLRLPLTLAIQRALLARVGGEQYAIPLAATLELVRAPAGGLEKVEGLEVMRLRDTLLPVLRLEKVVPAGAADERTGTGPASGHGVVVVVTDGQRRFGLFADALAGEYELVFKALEGRWAATPLASGAALLGDGRAILILDVSALGDRLAQGGSRRLAIAKADSRAGGADHDP